MPLSNKERQRRWMEKNRAAFNLRRRNARKGSGLVEKEAVVQTAVSGIEMARNEILGGGAEKRDLAEKSVVSTEAAPSAHPFTTKKVGEFRMIVLPEEKPVETLVSDDTRSAKDVVGGIYRNDFGGVISKSAWDKLQRLKEHAKENNFEIDDYSQ